MSTPMWQPCCPPFPIIEAAIGEDPSMPNSDGFSLQFYKFDTPREGQLQQHKGLHDDYEILSSDNFLQDSRDSLSLICSRCGKAAVFTESPIEPKQFRVTYSTYGVGDDDTEFQIIVTALDGADAIRIIEACHKIRLHDYSIVMLP